MKKALTIFIGFLHDFAAGCWAASVVVVYWLDRIAGREPGLRHVLDGLERWFFWAGLWCIAVVLIAGAGRTFTYTYIGTVYGEEAEHIRRRMLIIKHIVLIAVFGLGTWWQYSLAFSR